MTEFDKIENKIRKRIDPASAIEIAFAKELGVKQLRFRKTEGDDFGSECWNITIDNYTIRNLEIDQWNNLQFSQCSIMPIEYLKKLRRFFNEYLENRNSYHHRTGTAFFINYFEEYSNKLNIQFVQAMCNIDDIDNEGQDDGDKYSGLRNWLIGTSYDSDGNLQRFKNWKYKHFEVI